MSEKNKDRSDWEVVCSCCSAELRARVRSLPASPKYKAEVQAELCSLCESPEYKIGFVGGIEDHLRSAAKLHPRCDSPECNAHAKAHSKARLAESAYLGKFEKVNPDGTLDAGYSKARRATPETTVEELATLVGPAPTADDLIDLHLEYKRECDPARKAQLKRRLDYLTHQG